MRIIERYPAGIRAWSGRGAWAFLLPARAVAAAAWRLGAAWRGGAAPPPPGGRRPRVISVGNLEVGGGGKTPFAILLAGAVRDGGGRPVVVT
ncbi:MAG: tetraacyldisaccharide 4'-kinase, partial [Candidatus Krumholzibacteriota bacterium]|nr:tetraacyldisaccharide 4'-kinase [Candidatus Krumholzibacteriota bacterium]